MIIVGIPVHDIMRKVFSMLGLFNHKTNWSSQICLKKKKKKSFLPLFFSGPMHFLLECLSIYLCIYFSISVPYGNSEWYLDHKICILILTNLKSKDMVLLSNNLLKFIIILHL